MQNRREFIAAGISVVGMLASAGCEQPGAESKSTTQPSKEGTLVTSETVKVKVFNKKGELVGPIEEPKVVKTDAEWKKQRYQNIRISPAPTRSPGAKGTEAAVLRHAA